MVLLLGEGSLRLLVGRGMEGGGWVVGEVIFWGGGEGYVVDWG